MTHDSPTRLTAAEWITQAELCRRDGRDDLVPMCLDFAAAVAAESVHTLAEMLEKVA